MNIIFYALLLFACFNAMLKVHEEQQYQRVKEQCNSYGYSEADITKNNEWCIKIISSHVEIQQLSYLIRTQR